MDAWNEGTVVMVDVTPTKYWGWRLDTSNRKNFTGRISVALRLIRVLIMKNPVGNE